MTNRLHPERTARCLDMGEHDHDALCAVPAPFPPVVCEECGAHANEECRPGCTAAVAVANAAEDAAHRHMTAAEFHACPRDECWATFMRQATP